ncbi:glycosyltransferase family 4 protein [Allokutzneria sp. A3M-2-11 16]|uniref:glycosyltransferase family 4 protein n=1 Tax=Allokutzneria sp. A3M-2-11 16 TaxID=2962043 RepID=UPI0020B81820|nr:glycosyltransferase family 1 protein [Allokutzneria sp. A3M-2-11 16]MCP3800493.1 glycosyltransferase family 4 protein [Allokutzneria sp. A3M-2-11 16]
MADHTKPLRVLLDGNPLLGDRTGVGRYTSALAEELASMAEIQVRAVAFTTRGWRQLRTVVPHGVKARGLPVPARALRACWLKSSLPPIELFAGPTDVVHGTNFVLPPSLRAGGVLTIHDLAFLDAADELSQVESDLPELVRVSAKRAAVILTPTRAVADVVRERLRVPSDKIVVTPLGVDPAWFVAQAPSLPLRRRLKLPESYVLYVGAENPRKGLPNLLKAHGASAALPPLVLAGPGTARVDGDVIRTGYLSELDLRRVVAGASALVLPSRDEGFGLPVLEALACGVPVVCSDVPSLREVSGGQALHVPVGDVEALTDALETVVKSSADAATLAARRTRAAEFTWRRCAELTVEAYHRAAS